MAAAALLLAIGIAASPAAAQPGTSGLATEAAAGVGTLLAGAASDATPRLVFGGRVLVGADGNGARAARFAAPARSRFRYVLVAESGCGSGGAGPASRCPAPISQLTVMLNGEVVFESTGEVDLQHVALPAATLLARNNRLVITAGGAPGSGARVAILAVRRTTVPGAPLPKPRLVFGGRVVVGADGNGARAARFAAPARNRFRYVLIAESGCGSAGASRCPPPASQLTVMLNGEVVFESTGEVDLQHVALPAAALLARNNRLVLTAGGAPGSGARVAILAVRRAGTP